VPPTPLPRSSFEFPNRVGGILPSLEASPRQIDPFYLFACHVEWERREDPSAGWELISAAQSMDGDTRANARSLLASSRHLSGAGCCASVEFIPHKRRQAAVAENEMKAPYGIEIVENCAECPLTNGSFFCGFPHAVREALDQVSHKSILPAGAILFVEGQVPRGVFVVCSGKVNLSTTSREGKTLILKTASPGEPLGLSAAISGTAYEATAETATPSQLNFVDRKNFLELMQSHSEIGVHAAQCLSRDFRSAHRDIHDLVLTRSSAGKLARLLLTQYPRQEEELETRLHSIMTHEEMAHRIGASRETVTRLLTDLRRKQLIRLDGPTLVIRDRPGLEALAR
jgi:CRP/FNR family transcriptional regulator